MHEHKSNDPTKVYSCINCGIDFDASRSKEISAQVVRCVKCGEGLLVERGKTMGFAQLAWKKINLFRAGYVHGQKQYFPCSESRDDSIFWHKSQDICHAVFFLNRKVEYPESLRSKFPEMNLP